jgi:hypothetical protein
VFRRRDNTLGYVEYIYHGNDGTSFPWNDTAQLNYLRADVREQVIQTILHVARLFPIIRFDAAMTLARRHVQRLWFPLPGHGGSIPSRAEYAMTQEQFDAAMPHEFWREVVDRVAAEVPGTLLLAEAFWLLEGYFVRTLGMHRVYNSAFMNMMRDEENAKYRSVIKNTIEFDPDILKRYVNFMSNPDERTAIDQFGTGDKYFGVCTMMATLPGLPMFGHGQIEAFTEKYGMEYKRPRYEETPNHHLVERHQREIAPLLKNRRVFAESENFALFDFWREDGTVDENVFAWSNRLGDQRALVVYHNKYANTKGTLHGSAAKADKTSGGLSHVKLHEALALPVDGEALLAFQDNATGLHYLRRAKEVHDRGLQLQLGAYQYHAFQNWRPLRATEEHPWDALCSDLAGGGVWSLDEALAKLKLRPVHQALKRALAADLLRCYSDLGEEAPTNGDAAKLMSRASQAPCGHDETLDALAQRAERFFREALATVEVRKAAEEQVAVTTGSKAGAASERYREAQKKYRRLLEAAARIPRLEKLCEHTWPTDARAVLPSDSPTTSAAAVWSPVVAWCLLRVFVDLLPEGKHHGEVFDALYLRSELAEVFHPVGLESDAGYRAAARVRVLIAAAREPEAGAIAWDDPDVAWLTGLHEAEGHRYFNKEAHEQMVWWAALPRLVELAGKDAPGPPAVTRAALRTLEAENDTAVQAAKTAGYRLDEMRQELAAEPVAAPTPPRATEAARTESVIEPSGDMTGGEAGESGSAEPPAAKE